MQAFNIHRSFGRAGYEWRRDRERTRRLGARAKEVRHHCHHGKEGELRAS